MNRVKILLLAAVIPAIIAGCRSVATPTTPVATLTPPVATPTPTPRPATCQAVPSIFASLPALDVPEVTPQDWVKGAADAQVTLIEYSDFQ